MMPSFVIMSLEPVKCAVHQAVGFCLDLRKVKKEEARSPGRARECSGESKELNW